MEVIVDGYPSYCSNTNNNCQFQYLIDQTPTITSLVQNGLNITITGNGFSSLPQSNTVLIGDDGSCQVIASNTTTLLCTIGRSASGMQVVRVNVGGKGYASTNGTLTVNVSLIITSFEPMTGGGGGGYLLKVYGNGFSSNTIVIIDGSVCITSETSTLSHIVCTVPPARAQNISGVVLSVIDGINTVNATSLFVYNTSSGPMISSIEPRVITMDGEVMNITGTRIGDGLAAVFIGVMNARILSSSSSHIQITLPKLPPGLYPVSISTSEGYALSPVQIEYRFYVQRVFPQIVSLYDGTDIFIHGEGLNNNVGINFRDQSNRLYPCTIVTTSSNTIHCKTVSLAKNITITADGIHPLYGSGFAWSSSRQTVEQGTLVIWKWSSPQSLNLTYNVQEASNAYTTEPSTNGFVSDSASSSGE